MKSPARGFTYVDFASSRLNPFRNHVVHISRIKEMVGRCGAHDCYTTYMRFDRKIFDHLNHMKEKTGKPSISGYRGEVCSSFLPFDLDSEELSRAQETARKLVHTLMDWGVEEEAILIYFSSSAGLHVMLDTRTFGGSGPLESLHRIFANMRLIIARESSLNLETVDLSIKDKLRLWRVPNTRSRKSALYKIQLTYSELFKLTPQQIKQKARSPEPVFFTDESGLSPRTESIRTNGRLRTVWKQAIRQCLSSEREDTQEEPRDRIDRIKGIDFKRVFCPAEQRIASRTIEQGMRNECAVRLVSKLRAKGFTRRAAEQFIEKWNVANRIGLPERELKSVVNSAYYPDRKYQYACNDPILRKFCPFTIKSDCDKFRRYKILRVF